MTYLTRLNHRRDCLPTTRQHISLLKLADGHQLHHQLWETDWDVKFNLEKEVVQIPRERSPILTKYSMHGKTLEVVSWVRYLGVDISDELFHRYLESVIFVLEYIDHYP